MEKILQKKFHERIFVMLWDKLNFDFTSPDTLNVVVTIQSLALQLHLTDSTMHLHVDMFHACRHAPS